MKRLKSNAPARTIPTALAFLFLLGALTSLTPACSDPDGSPLTDAAAPIDGFPAPRSDIAPAIGSETTLDLATWNVEFFPKSERSPVFLTDLIASLDLDLIAVEEIADIQAFDEVMQRLAEHEGVLSPHTYANGSYQKLGFIYKVGLISLSPIELLFVDDSYLFPRPPIQTNVTLNTANGASLDFVLIAIHLKAGIDPEDGERRRAAVIALDAHIRDLLANGTEDEVVVIGDFNEVATNPLGLEVLGPFLGATDTYTVETEALGLTGGVSFLPAGIMLDHIVTTTGLDEEVGTATVVIPPLSTQVPRYEADLSDHLPVTLSIPLPN